MREIAIADYTKKKGKTIHGAIQLVVVANKFNLPLNKTRIDALQVFGSSF